MTRSEICPHAATMPWAIDAVADGWPWDFSGHRFAVRPMEIHAREQSTAQHNSPSSRMADLRYCALLSQSSPYHPSQSGRMISPGLGREREIETNRATQPELKNGRRRRFCRGAEKVVIKNRPRRFLVNKGPRIALVIVANPLAYSTDCIRALGGTRIAEGNLFGRVFLGVAPLSSRVSVRPDQKCESISRLKIRF
jgi:hypothetical protein